MTGYPKWFNKNLITVSFLILFFKLALRFSVMYRLIQQNKQIKLNDLPRGENLTNFSILNDLSEKHTFRSFSIKYESLASAIFIGICSL